jgi:hypothetical protein
MLVHLVVGELDFLKGDDLLPELLAGEGRIGVHIKATRGGRVGFTGHEPR